MIGLQSTGEANTNQARDEEGDSMDDFASAPKAILQLFLTRHFPTDDCELMPHELDLLQHQVNICSISKHEHSVLVLGQLSKTSNACLLLKMDDFISAPITTSQLFLTRHSPNDNCELMPHQLDLLQHQMIVPAFLTQNTLWWYNPIPH